MKKIQNRFLSPVLWLGLITLIINQLGFTDVLGINEGNMKIIIDSIITILVALGIYNNPTAKDKF
jgi:uncharacterized membrane protein